MATATKPLPRESVSQFDLQQEIARSQAHQPWASGIFSKTLIKQNDMRVVLTLMEPNAVMNEHHADGSIAVQVMRGKLLINAQGTGNILTTGNILSLPPSVPHDVHAIEPSAFLITISWPESDKLRSMPHRGYGA